jgi:hypothetical protein
MNERMLELHKLAHVPHTAIDPSNNMPYDTTRFSADKFAELIVQECVQSIEKTIETICDTDSEKMGCEFAITDMLGHFGVGE